MDNSGIIKTVSQPARAKPVSNEQLLEIMARMAGRMAKCADPQAASAWQQFAADVKHLRGKS